MRLNSWSIFLTLATLCASGAAGCDKSSAPDATASEPVRVFATVHTIGDLARQVGGKYVQVDFGIENGRSLLNLQPSAAIIAQKNSAQIVIAGGSEPWAIADASKARETNRVIRLDAVRDAMRGAANAASSKPTSVQNDDTQIGLEWLDPVIGQRSADELAKRLTFLRPAHQVYFESRAKQFNEQIDALLAEYKPKFQAAPRRRVMSLTHEFDYLAERFNVDVVHVVGTTPERIGEAQLSELARASRNEHLTTLLIRVDTPAGLIDDLAKRSGLRLITMDPYGASSSNGHDSYLELLRYNMNQLLDAVGAAKP